MIPLEGGNRDEGGEKSARMNGKRRTRRRNERYIEKISGGNKGGVDEIIASNGVNGSKLISIDDSYSNGGSGEVNGVMVNDISSYKIIFIESYSFDELIQKFEIKSNIDVLPYQSKAGDRTCLVFLTISLNENNDIDNLFQYSKFLKNFQGIEFSIQKSLINQVTSKVEKLKTQFKQFYFSIKLKNEVNKKEIESLLLIFSFIRMNSSVDLLDEIHEEADKEIQLQSQSTHLTHQPINIISACKGPENQLLIYREKELKITNFEVIKPTHTNPPHPTFNSTPPSRLPLKITPPQIPSIVLLSPLTTYDPIQKQLHHRRKSGYQDIPSLHNDTNYASHLEFWGLTIIISSTLIFIFGIISVLGIWDIFSTFQPNYSIKATSYAEYEEITGLPIQNYYPSMIILFSVIAWVWCIISWMGMKFFRHSKGGANNT